MTPCLDSDHPLLNRAFRLAVGDTLGNIAPYQDGLLKKKEPVILAGMDYGTPWTRDAAINTWNGVGLMQPQAALNTLLAVLEKYNGKVHIAGEYWDAIIWACGAWAYYLYTGDRAFLGLALEAVANSLHRFEREEFNPVTGLFRGQACYGDGIAAYPDIYTRPHGASGLTRWPALNPKLASHPGFGLPMQALSTNCLYYRAYVLAGRMAKELGHAPDKAWAEKAKALNAAIQSNFWDARKGTYRYLVDDFGGSNAQEGLGLSFAMLFGLAQGGQRSSVLRTARSTPAGIACVWPTFARYRRTKSGYGRHSGTVWPFIQGFWIEVLAGEGKQAAMERELLLMARHAVDHGEFTEIVHPFNHKPYGGLQEDRGQGIRLWESCRRQTWSATGFIRAVLMGVLGLKFEPGKLRLQPRLITGMKSARLSGLIYQGRPLEIAVERKKGGTTAWINGKKTRL
jgi:glycogen debranching enzyme